MNVVSKIISVIVSILAIFCVLFITYLNVLPTKYYVLFIGLVFLFTLPTAIFLFRKKTKVWGKCILILFSIFLIGLFFYGSKYAYSTISFMNKAGEIKEESETYYVVVHKESSYNVIKDVKDKKLSIFEEKNESFDKAKKELEKQISFTTMAYTDLRKMATDLLSKKGNILFLKDSHKKLFDEEIDTFEEKTKIIGTITITTKVTSISKEVKTEETPFSVYISGIDTYGSISAKSRSDVNLIMTVNPKTNEILLTSIPRDYYVQLHGTTGSKDKLTHAGIYGINMSVKTIEDLLSTTLNYYVRVNFDTLIKVVDVVGGIDIYSDITFPSSRNVSIVKGMNHLDGKTALVFARERKSYVEGDRHRGQNQQDVLSAIIKKVSSSKTLLTKYTEILKSLEGTFQTNLNLNNMTGFVKNQIDEMPSWNIKTYNLDGFNSSNVTYSMGNMRLYVMEPDRKTVEKATYYINGMKEGKSMKELGLS